MATNFPFEKAFGFVLMFASIGMQGFACWHLYTKDKQKREREEERLKRIRSQVIQKTVCYCNKNCYNGCNGQDCVD